jgi:hypothetical protein
MTETTKVVTPKLAALELKGFAEGIQVLVETIDNAAAAEATPEHKRTPEDRERLVRAENAALALLRNAPLAVRSIRRLEGFAEATAERATKNRDKIMTSMFGPDTA